MFGLITIKKHHRRVQQALDALNRIVQIELDKLRKERDHFKYEARIWRNLYEELYQEELKGGKNEN